MSNRDLIATALWRHPLSSDDEAAAAILAAFHAAGLVIVPIRMMDRMEAEPDAEVARLTARIKELQGVIGLQRREPS